MKSAFVFAFEDELEKISKVPWKGIAKGVSLAGIGAGAGIGGEKLLEGRRKRKSREELKKFMAGRRVLLGGDPEGKLMSLVTRRAGEEPGTAGKTFHKYLMR